MHCLWCEVKFISILHHQIFNFNFPLDQFHFWFNQKYEISKSRGFCTVGCGVLATAGLLGCVLEEHKTVTVVQESHSYCRLDVKLVPRILVSSLWLPSRNIAAPAFVLIFAPRIKSPKPQYFHDAMAQKLS